MSDLDAEHRARLTQTWAPRPGVLGWLSEVNHKAIALRYLATAMAFFVLAGLLALVMRLQLARPSAHLVGPDLYNQLFTVHGSTMMFLFAVPAMEAMGLYLVPMMIGTRNVAFPRMNAFGYYVYLIGGLFLWVGLALNIGADAGWFSYVPLAGPQYSPGKRADIWAQMITFTELAALVAAIEIIVTTFKQRAPGMTLDRIPIVVWAMVVTSFMIIFAMPAVMVSSGMLALDRLIDTQFFNPAEGGDVLLWQHLFWFFGHPEVYIIFVPATGFVSAIVTTFSRRSVFGYLALVLSLVATGFLAFGLWVHHMFAVGLPEMGQGFFTAASMMIAIPNGVQIFCWLATLIRGRLLFRTPLLFVLGFIVIFVAGGLTGVMLAAVPFDLQVHDTYFVVAHFHYVLVGGAVFPLLGAFYYWLPKMTGRRLSEKLGQASFWLLFVGFNLTFFPMHQLGLAGMPRRVYTYLPDTGWGGLNLLSTVGAFTIAAAVMAFTVNVLWSVRRGAPAGDDPWGAATLEWSTPSPPPTYNFVRIPVVHSRYPRWTPLADPMVTTGLRDDLREVVITSMLDAEPTSRHLLDGPTIIPLLTALGVGVGLIAGIFTPWGFVMGAALVLPCLVAWFWPKGEPARELAEGRV